jgi:hypothetical protein
VQSSSNGQDRARRGPQPRARVWRACTISAMGRPGGRGQLTVLPMQPAQVTTSAKAASAMEPPWSGALEKSGVSLWSSTLGSGLSRSTAMPQCNLMRQAIARQRTAIWRIMEPKEKT